MARDDIPAALLGVLFQIGDPFQRGILQPTASQTSDMIVLIGIALITTLSVPAVSPNQACLGQGLQVPVNRGQTDARQVPADHAEDLVSGRVVYMSSKIFENHLALRSHPKFGLFFQAGSL
jgi:hypothetical protein